MNWIFSYFPRFRSRWVELLSRDQKQAQTRAGKDIVSTGEHMLDGKETNLALDLEHLLRDLVALLADAFVDGLHAVM